MRKLLLAAAPFVISVIGGIAFQISTFHDDRVALALFAFCGLYAIVALAVWDKSHSAAKTALRFPRRIAYAVLREQPLPEVRAAQQRARAKAAKIEDRARQEAYNRRIARELHDELAYPNFMIDWLQHRQQEAARRGFVRGTKAIDRRQRLGDSIVKGIDIWNRLKADIYNKRETPIADARAYEDWYRVTRDFIDSEFDAEEGRHFAEGDGLFAPRPIAGGTEDQRQRYECLEGQIERLIGIWERPFTL